jgi:ubiquitin C-terminal hydrolase
LLDKFNYADEIIKNKDKVVFQIENQSLSPLAENLFYDLVAIACHLGTDLSSGHYVNYVLENDKWVD